MMDFMNLIQNKICHLNALTLVPGPVLHCQQCQRDVLGNIYEYINRPDHGTYFHSSALAQAYAAWTGDEHVPMSFPITDIEGIHDTVNVGQPLSRVRKSIRLLRALNAPFTTQPLSTEETLDESFLTEFLNIIYEHPNAESSHERMALDALIKSMHKILTMTSNPFETYFHVLVPFVQKCVETFQPLPATPEDPNHGRELYLQLRRSFAIRKMFGKFAIPFDVLHVIVCCYACSNSMDIVGNWALDFLARIARGEFFWGRYPDCPYVKTMQRLVSKEYSYRKRTDYYNAVVRPIRSGESIHCYSTLWAPLHDMQAHLRKRFSLPDLPDSVLDVAFTHAFPAVLFQDLADQLGFTMGYNHLIMTVNRRNGQLPKGAFKQAKRVHAVVKRFVERVQQFEGGQPILWTLDTVKLFFASDPHFEDEMMQVIRMLVADDEEEE